MGAVSHVDFINDQGVQIRVQPLQFLPVGGKTVETFEQLQQRIPERIIEKAIKGMLPKNRLGRQLFKKLKVYQEATHPHTAQKPELIKL